MNQDFHFLQLDLPSNLFALLSDSVDFEDLAKGRKGNHLLAQHSAGIPLVRTTTQYHRPANYFTAIHQQIIQSIQTAWSKTQPKQADLHFNNALIELYDAQYSKMKYHSDQALDLAENGYIALFSCYEQPEKLSKKQQRKLKIKAKNSEEESEYILENNSVVLFSVASNRHFLHKIILDVNGSKPSDADDNRWLGITFRQSKTFIHFKDKLPYFENGMPLTMADESQNKQFYQLRGQENAATDFVYPDIYYTLSQADTMPPVLR